MKLIDLTGQKFNQLFVISRAENRGKKPMWLCICDCGNNTIVGGSDLKSSHTRSCGHLKLESATRHGMHKTKEYQTWQAMKARCCTKSSIGYHRYGGRGISVCDHWRDSFENFYADMGNRPHKHSLDRIDNDKDYTPENCKWSTAKQQMNNSSINRILAYKGESHTVAEWSEILGIRNRIIHSRLERNWPVERIFTEPLHANSLSRKNP